MHTILIVIQVLLAISIIVLVLLQHGKGADAGAAFGSGASGTVFGSRGSSNFLSRATGVLAALFFASSLSLAYLVHSSGSSQGASVVNKLKQQPSQTRAPKQLTPGKTGQGSQGMAPAQKQPAQAPSAKKPKGGQGAGNIPEAPPPSGQSGGQ